MSLSILFLDVESPVFNITKDQVRLSYLVKFIRFFAKSIAPRYLSASNLISYASRASCHPCCQLCSVLSQTHPATNTANFRADALSLTPEHQSTRARYWTYSRLLQIPKLWGSIWRACKPNVWAEASVSAGCLFLQRLSERPSTLLKG